MLRLHTSNRLEALARRLAEVTRQPLRSPFQAELVVVQSQGMARWLKLELAGRHSICANYSFPFPKVFCAQVLGAGASTPAGQPPADREIMLWEIMRLLPEMLGQAEFSPLKSYLSQSADLRKRLQLCSQIANLFDQYLVFRPDLVLGWDEGLARRPHEPWQAALWRRLRQDKPEPHLAALMKEFGAGTTQPDLPERISIFGISALPPSYLRLFAALGSRIDVHLFLLQPSKEYWGQIVSARESERLLKATGKGDAAAEELHLERGNRLLASMGQLGRDFLNLVLDAGDWDEDAAFFEPSGGGLLQQIQADLFHLHDRGREPGRKPFISDGQASIGGGQAIDGSPLTPCLSPSEGERVPRKAGEGGAASLAGLPASASPKLAIEPGDASLRVHSCHSPLREVEVLYDHLLDWFERDPKLAPREVLVMTPDIEAYAPFIQAVFDSPEEPGKRIPFSVADCGVTSGSAIASTFLALLKLSATRLEASSVLRILETGAVREKFGLAESDLDVIRVWVRNTNIRWGRDAKQREGLGLPGLAGNTWQQGIERLLAGYAMAGKGERMFQGVLPYDEVEGGNAELLGHFAGYLTRLFDLVASLSERRAVAEWEAILVNALGSFFLPQANQLPEALFIRSTLRELAAQATEAGCVEPVDLEIILESLEQRLTEDRFGSGFLTGGVTFCALKPMRSIPFKVICLIGMNDGAFPRTDRHLSFDLMAQQPRLGDRSLRADDRYLFLETLLSARERLHISYVGQSIRDNSEAPPSVLVSELLDYVAQGYEVPGRDIVNGYVLVRHRLQAFSPAYFTGQDVRLFSYSAENCRASHCGQAARAMPTAFFEAPLSAPDAEWRTVDVEALAEFFCNPARWLVTRRLGLRFEREDEALEEVEPFTVGALDSYAIRQELVDMSLRGSSPAEALVLMKVAGRLPLGEAGTVEFRGLEADVQAFLGQLRPHYGAGYVEPVQVDFTLGEFRVVGEIRGLTTNGLLHFRCAKVKAKDLLRLWAQHLVLNSLPVVGEASRLPPQAARAILVGRNKVFEAPPLSRAPELLADMLDLYWKGLNRPLKFFPQTAWAYAEVVLKQQAGRSRQDPMGAAFTQWEGNPYQHVPGECGDPYFDLCFRNVNPLDDEFQQTARAVFEPLLGELKETEL